MNNPGDDTRLDARRWLEAHLLLEPEKECPRHDFIDDR
jgi:hypothetical protein